MQSGEARTKEWVLELEAAVARVDRSADGLDQLG